jgi:hypothetical protein
MALDHLATSPAAHLSAPREGQRAARSSALSPAMPVRVPLLARLPAGSVPPPGAPPPRIVVIAIETARAAAGMQEDRNNTMKWTIAAVALSGLLCGCVPAPPPAQSLPSAAPVSAAAPVPAPPVSPGAHIITIRKVPCADLLSATEDDRAAGSTFLLGYEAARLGIRRIDVADVEGIETAALDNCAAHPDQPAANAFARVFEEMKK